MSTQLLLSRSFGYHGFQSLKTPETSRLVYALQPSSVSFSWDPPTNSSAAESAPQTAHISGVNALTVDKFEGRYLLSGGADSSVAIWDLESRAPAATPPDTPYRPLCSVSKTSEAHSLGITQLSFYPFDSLAFLSSSYDHTVKLYSSESLQVSASFDLDSVVYNIALSPISAHLLIACATQHPAVRLVDLRSGSTSHSLAGHSGAILSVAWSPTNEHTVCSGGIDGTVRLWDVRRSAGELGILDKEDSLGLKHSSAIQRRATMYGKAHAGPVNGISWTEDGRHIITAGHDERVRVWNSQTYANTLANFGPMIRNSHLAPLVPLLAPSKMLPLEKDIIFYPGDHEILMYELFDGNLIRRLRRPQHRSAFTSKSSSKHRSTRDRIMSLAWRSHDVQLYSAHSDGCIAVWGPRTEEDAMLDEEEQQEREEETNDKKRKRGALEDIYQDLTQRRVTFGSSG